MISINSASIAASRSISSTGKFESWILILTIAGYPIVAGMSQLTGIENRPISIGMRALLLTICILVLARFHFTQLFRRNMLFWFAWWTFWIAYLIRLGIDTFLIPTELQLANTEYWFFAVGTCLIPGVASSRGNTTGAIRYATQKLYWLIVLGAALNIAVMITSQAIENFDTLRAETEVLNPIALGHLGTSILLMAIWKISEFPKTSFLERIAIYVCCAFAAFTLFVSASKGPILALFFALSLYAAIRPREFFSRDLIAFLLLLLIIGALNFSTLEDSFIVSRFTEGVFNDSVRIGLISQAIQLFQSSPIFGAGIEPLNTYPHNLIIESFLSFGLLTGIPFCTMLICTFSRIISLARHKECTFWVSLLFVQYCIAAMFSGSLYGSYIFWVLMVLVIAQPVRSTSSKISKHSLST